MDSMFRPRGPASIFSRFLYWIAAFDTETLYRCPPADWSNAAAIGILMILTWAYQTVLFALIGHRLYSPDSFSLSVLIASAFIASFLLCVDSYEIMRSGHHAAGVEALKRAGLDVSGGKSARIKAAVFLTIRLLLSVCLSLLTAIIGGLLVFSTTISLKLHSENLTANAHLLPIATTAVDDQVRRAADVVSAGTAREQAIAAQLNTLRQSQIDPAANDPAVRQAEQEIADLIGAKGKADADVKRARSFASDELAGVQGAPGNSGQAGNGPRRRAAMEAIANAENQARVAANAVEAGRARLADLRRQNASTSESAKQQARAQLPEYERMLAVEEKKLTDAKAELARLTREREATIAAAVAAAPDYVQEDHGFLAQIAALKHIAESDATVRAVIWLIDFTSFGFELAAVLAKVTSWVPSRYNVLIASDAYMTEVRIVDDIMEELNQAPQATESRLLIAPPIAPSPDNFLVPDDSDASPDPFGGHMNASAKPPEAGDASTPVKRGRGRPRKNRLH